MTKKVSDWMSKPLTVGHVVFGLIVWMAVQFSWLNKLTATLFTAGK